MMGEEGGDKSTLKTDPVNIGHCRDLEAVSGCQAAGGRVFKQDAANTTD